jgi:hypothetical protein
MTEPLSLLEREELERHERTIAEGLQTFIEVGQALLEIRRKKLYRHASYETFDVYCRERWGMSRVHAHRMIAASTVTIRLPIGNKLPATESQARSLTARAPAYAARFSPALT